MSWINIDVDLDEFDDDDLIDECASRYERKGRFKKDLLEELGLNERGKDPPKFEVMTDQMKYDYFMEHFDEITLESLESAVTKSKDPNQTDLFS